MGGVDRFRNNDNVINVNVDNELNVYRSLHADISKKCISSSTPLHQVTAHQSSTGDRIPIVNEAVSPCKRGKTSVRDSHQKSQIDRDRVLVGSDKCMISSPSPVGRLSQHGQSIKQGISLLSTDSNHSRDFNSLIYEYQTRDDDIVKIPIAVGGVPSAFQRQGEWMRDDVRSNVSTQAVAAGNKGIELSDEEVSIPIDSMGRPEFISSPSTVQQLVFSNSKRREYDGVNSSDAGKASVSVHARKQGVLVGHPEQFSEVADHVDHTPTGTRKQGVLVGSYVAEAVNARKRDVPVEHSNQHFDVTDISSQEENILNWMENSDIVTEIRSMGEILSDRSDLATHISINDIAAWNKAASEIMNEKIPQPANECDLLQIDYERVLANIKIVREIGVNSFIDSSAQSGRLKGQPPEEIRRSLEGFEDVETLIDLLSNGQRCIMKSSFKPNGGKNVRQSSSYAKAKSLCHHAIAELYGKGRVALLPWDLLTEEEKATFHVNPLVWAPKSDAWEGRTCLNLSHGNQLSVNEGTDTTRSDEIYKPSKLPDVHSICEMIEANSEKNPGKNIHGATVDVSAAYQQFSLSTEAARLRSTLIDIPYRNGTKPVLVIYLVGVFGDTRASHVYNTIGRSIDYKHNLLKSVTKSQTYIDDGIVADIEEDIEHTIQEYCDDITFKLGDEAVKAKKRINYKFDLQAIGFRFNLRKNVWRVGPKPRGILKMYLALFILFPPEFTDESVLIRVQRKRLLQVASLLSWYAQVIPAGTSFVHSLYRNAGWGPDLALVEVDVDTKRDVYWWRLIIITSLKNPDFFSAKISHLRVNKREDIMMYSDASSEIGGGAWLTRDGVEILNEGFIRWTREELEMFNRHLESSTFMTHEGVSINVLEFFSLVYFVLRWRHMLRGSVVKTNCDNAATVSWLSRMRACGRSPVSEVLMKFFALV